MVRQAPVICVMAPPIHLGAWSMAMAAFTFTVSYTSFALDAAFTMRISILHFAWKCTFSQSGSHIVHTCMFPNINFVMSAKMMTQICTSPLLRTCSLSAVPLLLYM